MMDRGNEPFQASQLYQVNIILHLYSSHINMSKDELAKHGVTPGMIRISVGVEGVEDLIEDFRQALRRVV